MDLAPIRALIALAEEHGLTELEVETEELSVRLVRPGPAEQPAPVPVAVSVPVPLGSPSEQTVTVKAPMAGTFYSAPAPDAEPFVRVGRPVTAGAVLCIIESMKMMNEIKAPSAGECVEVLVADGTAIETGQPLFRLR